MFLVCLTLASYYTQYTLRQEREENQSGHDDKRVSCKKLLFLPLKQKGEAVDGRWCRETVAQLEMTPPLDELSCVSATTNQVIQLTHTRHNGRKEKPRMSVQTFSDGGLE